MLSFRRNSFTQYLFIILLVMCFGITSYATNDDPGIGRLSGSSVPAEFYETSNAQTNTNRLGDAFTKSPYTNKTYSHRSDLVDRPITHGIDVSEWQKEIDWNKVKADGIQYAFIRVGYRGSTKGTLSDDAYYQQNLANATAAGIEVGAYIFSQAITKEEAREEANYLIERIKDYNITFPVVLDYEFTSDKGRLEKAKLSKEEATAICLEFCKTISNAGYTPMVYANPDMLNNYLNPSEISDKYLVWLANYTTETSYTGKYDYWQYSSDGSVDGINGRVDMNFFYGTDIASVSIAAIPDQTYTGSNVKPALTIMYKDRLLIEGIDYTVKYSKNKNIGTAKATVTGKGIFFGSQTLKFKIIPRQMTTVKAKKKADTYLTLSWKKDKSVTGYQIYRSTAIDGKYKKIATIKSNSTTTYKDKNLTNGQCYYYKIRGYKKIDGKNWYGAFSEIKNLYTNTGYTRNATAKENAIIYPTATISEMPLIVPAIDGKMTVTYATKDKSNKKWYRVSYKQDGMTFKGFVQSNQVTITMLGKTKGSNINVRKSNNTKSKIVTTLGKNKKVTILKSKKKNGTTWYQVEFKKKNKTYKGWISGDFIKLV